MIDERKAGAGLGLAILSAATFGTSGSFAKSLTDAGWSPGAAVAVRIGLAAAMLALPAAVAMRGRWAALRRDGIMVALYGLIAVAGCQVFFFNAVQTLSVGVALLLEYLGTVLVVFWLWIRHGHKPRRLTTAGAIIALVGLLLLLNVVSGTRLDPIGVLWALGAAFGLATFFILSAKTNNDLPPIAVAGAGMTVGAVALIGLGTVGLLPMHATFGDVHFAGHRTSWLVPVIGLSLLAAAIAYVAGIGAARVLGPKMASFVGLTEVIFGVLFAWLLLAELPTAIQLGGGLFIVAGVALVRIDEMRPTTMSVKFYITDPIPVTLDDEGYLRSARWRLTNFSAVGELLDRRGDPGIGRHGRTRDKILRHHYPVGVDEGEAVRAGCIDGRKHEETA